MYLSPSQISLGTLASTILIRNAQVFDGSYFNVGMVVLQGQYIQDVQFYREGGHEVTNCGKPCCYGACYNAAGKYLIPGLIDSHCHIFSPDDLLTLRSNGVTAALDMGTPFGELFYMTLNSSLYKSGQVPELFGSGSAATGNHSFLRCLPDFQQDALVQTIAEAETFVKHRAVEHTDYLKVVIANGSVAEKMEDAGACNSSEWISEGPWGPSVDLIKHLTGMAHTTSDDPTTASKYKMVFSHTSSYESFSMAQEGGVDVLTHMPLDGLIDDSVIGDVLAAGQVTVPTLIKMLQTCGPNCQAYPLAQANLRSVYSQKIPILVGTDAQNDMFHGVSFHGGIAREMLLLVQAGMKNIDVLLGATALPAKYFAQIGLGDRGQIKKGLRADLTLLEFNPLPNPRDTNNAVSPQLMSNIGSVLQTWVAGKCFVPMSVGGGNCSELAPPSMF